MGLLNLHHYGVPGVNSPRYAVSKLASFSALIISIILVVLFLVRYYLLEAFLIRRLYGSVYTNLSLENQRGFINHHIAGTMKFLILIIAAYPFIKVIVGNSTFHTPFVRGSPVMMGDILIVVAQMLIGMYVFELLYRTRLSPIAVLHHVGTIMIGQSAIAIGLDRMQEPDAGIEFMLCTIWGVFDIISEFFPHVAIILYRIYPQRHRFLSRVFLSSCITTAFGTFCETVVIMFLFGCLWDRWQVAFKVTTPILHIAFSAAQVHGSVVFWRMYKRQQRFLNEEAGQDLVGSENTEGDESESKDKPLVMRGYVRPEV
ncbi:hypothetical protein P170DRAFT_396949 [Aspergillus steynii IBT 23096]|uniref:Uncharacterized protein n=1 Tax=Aspergillus steynii IBT 23096 TaxID=1392250 RepID=A0A2I2GM42_9EURO|nr:uncharacterized protein P170DRAFT_396949 [Aspergillus steynii IBT 23096]PLB53952.1 hypothetical protein P170DRAFT_396949 [Aspergillus steynii IBT 23096]